VNEQDQTIALWDVATRKERIILQGQSHPLAFSPDGKTLASRSCDNAVKMWDVATGTARASSQELSKSLADIVFSPDGKTLASVRYDLDGIIKLWDVATGQERTILLGNGGHITCIAFRPDNKTIALGDATGVVTLRDVTTGMKTATFKCHDEAVVSAVFSPNGKTLASLDVDDQIHLWNVASGNTATFNVVTNSNRPRPRLLRMVYATFPGLFEKHRKTIRSMLFTPEGKLLAFGHDEHDKQTVKMWVVAAAPKRKR
jgi:WD40 repeat protein